MNWKKVRKLVLDKYDKEIDFNDKISARLFHEAIDFSIDASEISATEDIKEWLKHWVSQGTIDAFDNQFPNKKTEIEIKCAICGLESDRRYDEKNLCEYHYWRLYPDRRQNVH
jgi:hypothetical protein